MRKAIRNEVFDSFDSVSKGAEQKIRKLRDSVRVDKSERVQVEESAEREVGDLQRTDVVGRQDKVAGKRREPGVSETR